jgi:ubiquinone/menaquinone biosynthesis C-methylase UbiE
LSSHDSQNAAPLDADEVRRYRALERAWQDEIGATLLDRPFEAAGSAAVFHHQWDRLLAEVARAAPGPIVEVGCGRGHFLRYARERLPGVGPRLIGLDLSRAVHALPAARLAGVQADGEWLPFRTGAAACLVFDGALHHVIDYAAALREALRVLAPGGVLVIYEPLNSRFTSAVHRLLDPIVFRTAVQYESPIDIRFKGEFHEHRILAILRQAGCTVRASRSDFLAYPLTGCYAGSAFGRSLALMRALLRLEDAIARIPLLGGAARWFAWRFTIVARAPG